MNLMMLYVSLTYAEIRHIDIKIYDSPLLNRSLKKQGYRGGIRTKNFYALSNAIELNQES